MKKILVLLLSVMIVATSTPVYAGEIPDKPENEIVEEINLDEEMGMILIECIDLYLALEDKTDEDFIDDLKEELEAGFKIIISDDSDDKEMKESIAALEKNFFELEEKVKNENIEGREELLNEIAELEEKLKNKELSEEESESAQQALEALYIILDEVDEAFENDWYGEDDWDEEEYGEEFEDDWDDEHGEDYEDDWEEEYDEDYEDDLDEEYDEDFEDDWDEEYDEDFEDDWDDEYDEDYEDDWDDEDSEE